MYSSPVTPAGSGDSAPSSTYSRVLATAPPSGAPVAADSDERSTRQPAEKIAVSVGPYRFHRPLPPASPPPPASPLPLASPPPAAAGSRANRRSASSALSASPQVIPQRSSPSPSQPASSSRRQVTGVACSIVARRRVSSRRTRAPSPDTSRPA